MNLARTTIHAQTAYDNTFYGEGIGIAIVDTGVSMHPDLRDRIVGWYDAVHGNSHPYDDNGHGTHVAGIAAGNGALSHGVYQGIAPKANIIAVKALDKQGNGTINNVIKALRWIRQYHQTFGIRVINISIGTNNSKSFEEDCTLVKKVEELWHMGIAVVVAAGNLGPAPQTISAPGNSRKVITVGAIDHSFRNQMSHSGIGPTRSCIKKPDVVAPGFQIVSCCLPIQNNRFSYSRKNGTSMATPMISGGIALLLSRRPDLTPREIKIRLRNSCIDLHLPHERQGWGLLHIGRLLYSDNTK